MNGVGASQEQAIDLDDMGGGSSEVELLVSSTLNQLDGDTNLPAATTKRMSPTPQNQLGKDTEPASATAEHDSPLFVSQESPSPSNAEVGEALHPDLIERNGLAVVVPRLENQWEYRRYEESTTVVEILEEYDDGGFVEYLVQFDDESEEVLTFDEVFQLDNSRSLLARFEGEESEQSESADSDPKVSSRTSRRKKDLKNTHISSFALDSDDELTTAKHSVRKRRTLTNQRPNISSRSSRLRSSQSQISMTSNSDDSRSARKRRPPTRPLSTRATRAKSVNYSDIPTQAEVNGTIYQTRGARDLGKRKRSSLRLAGSRKGRKLLRGPRLRAESPSTDEFCSAEEGNRRSGRNRRSRDMREIGEDEIPERAAAKGSAKYSGAKEHFQELSDYDDFRLRHCQTCDVCYETGDNEEKGLLVYCQGCTISYHQKCLGPRTGREHLVTKIDEKDFVLQCRRCIGVPKQKDPMAPDQGLCSSCHEPGDATTAFRERKSTKEEQKEREENNGEDPSTEVLPDLVNNADTLLFRCLVCYRGCHLHHLPPKDSTAVSKDLNERELASIRFDEYSPNWSCKDCLDAPADVEVLVAWRPINYDTYEIGSSTDMMPGDTQEYLVKWKKLPYVRAQWMPGDWVWGVTAASMRKAFAKQNNHNNLPTRSFKEAVPEDNMRADIVFDVQYTNVVKQPNEKVAKARIKEVKKALIKFKGLGYEDVVWAEPPAQDDTDRWADYQAAYDDYVMGFFVHQPVKRDLDTRLVKLRTKNFKDSLVLTTQPEALTGGDLMAYQLEGLNWIYYQWFNRQNAILADEMGLGKTIQVIGFLATLKQIHSCWPFLVVVPNSTCPNWRREIKHWAPSLRVVTYYGSAEARRLAIKHELFPVGSKDLRCHVVVTSYDAAQDEEFRKIFRGVHWAGLVVDEGQRLKNDKGILYGALNALKAPFKLLLTGTPLQNNARELFNLLQFLDPSVNAQELEEEYATLTKENIAQLHTRLRNMFLRRTKAEVLKFLPSMAQIILPVTMSSLQKKLYRSILAQNPELIRSILGTSKVLGPKERANLNNILMQLRKCLAHPFVYSKAIEEKSSTQLHRNLVDASSKLQLLEVMLPKLQERGNRVLIFSQFLDMLDIVEDFLDGLGLQYLRLDGTLGSLEKQKRIDSFNAPNSSLFAFLLSTRAGGVGINLASADTVIILDPDFNPHQDIQALSRAHRIGQKKKVLVFQLTTRATAEEKIMQIGKKKMALDHVMIEQMDAADDAGVDVESILRHGTDALFKDDDTHDIKYDSASVDRLLDRSQIENTQTANDNSAESQFSFARVWANDKGTLEEGLGVPDDAEPDPSIWDAILKEREREAAQEAAARKEDLGRGRRKRQNVDYAKHTASPARKIKSGKGTEETDSDTDFMEHDSDEDEADSGDDGGEGGDLDVLREIEAPQQRPSRPSLSQASPVNSKGREVFKRAEVPALTANGLPPLPPANGYVAYSPPPTIPSPHTAPMHYEPPDVSRLPVRYQPTSPAYQMPPYGPQSVPMPQTHPTDGAGDPRSPCIACKSIHKEGYCPLKLAGPEKCNLCGIAHFGHARVCPHIASVTQLRAMLDAIKQSTEPADVKAVAKSKITGILGDLNQRRRRAAEASAHKNALSTPQNGVNGGPHGEAQTNGSGQGKENDRPNSMAHLFYTTPRQGQ